MSEPRPVIPVTADDVDYDFDASASPPPAPSGRALVAGHGSEDPGHIMAEDEWADVVERAEGYRP